MYRTHLITGSSVILPNEQNCNTDYTDTEIPRSPKENGGFVMLIVIR